MSLTSSRYGRTLRERLPVQDLREFLNTPTGAKVVAGVTGLFVLIAGYLLYRSVFVNEINELMLNDRVFICAETGKVFKVDLKRGMTFPVYSSASGKDTGYPAEFCYWTNDGRIKNDPTYVLMNTYAGKTGPTICPDCGRVVSSMNPIPRPGDKPPPLASELRSPKAAAGGPARPAR